MSNVRSTSSSAPQSQEIEFEADESEAFIAPPKRPRGSATPAAEDQVTPYVPKPGQEQTRPAAPMRSPEATSAAVRDAVRTAEARLIRRVFDPVVSDRDVAEVTKALSTLSPAEFKEAMEQLEKRQLLEVYFGNMEPEHRSAFISLAVAKGHLVQTAGKRIEGPLDPPSAPPLIENDRRLPTSLRDLIHAENVGRANGYFAAHARYAERYAAAVEAAPSLEAVRDLGPQRSAGSWEAEPGVPHSDEYSRHFREQRKARPSDLDAAEVLANKVAQLEDRRRAGTLALSGSITRTTPDGVSSQTLSAELRSDGTTQSANSAKTKGSSKVGGTKIGIGVQASGETPRVEVSVERRGTGATLRSDGRVELEREVVPGLKVHSKVDQGAGIFGGAVSLKFGDHAVKVGIDLKGLTAATARRTIDGEGVHDIPRELAAGRPWSEVSPERRAELQATNHWSEREWTRRLQERGRAAASQGVPDGT